MVMARATLVGWHTPSGLLSGQNGLRSNLAQWSWQWVAVQLEEESGDMLDTTYFLSYPFKIPKCYFFSEQTGRKQLQDRK